MANDDQTVRFLRDELDLPAPAADPTPPPPPPGPSGPPPPRRRGAGAVWLVVAVAVVLAFVAGAYLVVDRAEQDRPRGASDIPGIDTDPDPAATSTTTEAAPVTQDPASVEVVVLNGTPQRGWAAENGDRLDGSGYATVRSDALTDTVETTTVYVAAAELEPDGAAIAEILGFPDAPVEARPDDPLSEEPAAAEADVVVVLGADSLG